MWCGRPAWRKAFASAGSVRARPRPGRRIFSMTLPPHPGSWRLAADCREQAQGLIVSGFERSPYGVALLLDASAAPGARWLRAVLGTSKAPGPLVITNAVRETASSAAISF